MNKNLNEKNYKLKKKKLFKQPIRPKGILAGKLLGKTTKRLRKSFLLQSII